MYDKMNRSSLQQPKLSYEDMLRERQSRSVNPRRQSTQTNTAVQNGLQIKHKLYLKSNDKVCENTFAIFNKTYETESGLVTKEKNLHSLIEIINITKNPHLKAKNLRGVPCLLTYNQTNKNWTAHYGSEAIRVMTVIAEHTPADSLDIEKGSSVLNNGFSSTTGFAIDYAYDFETCNDYAKNKVDDSEIERMQKMRSAQESKFQNKGAPTNVTFLEPVEPSSRELDINSYMTKRLQMANSKNQARQRMQM